MDIAPWHQPSACNDRPLAKLDPIAHDAITEQIGMYARKVFRRIGVAPLDRIDHLVVLAGDFEIVILCRLPAQR